MVSLTNGSPLALVNVFSELALAAAFFSGMLEAAGGSGVAT
jgi:hypothetical protein